MTPWTTSDIPPQDGRTAVVTGTGGVGFEDARALARAGASVIIAGRSPDKGAAAVERIRGEVPAADVRFERLDLASLASVTEFAARLRSGQGSLDLLINNAGIMRPPARQLTADGFETQFGVNYLGHFALTGLLLPLLRAGRAPRVVTVSSVAAREGVVDFDNLNAERDYKSMPIYAQSKLACLIFALEMQRRSAAAGWGVASLAAHPGVARTELLLNAPGRGSTIAQVRGLLWFLFQPVPQAALPTLFAATAPGARPGGYYGPRRLLETRGYPAEARVPAQAEDRGVAARLWEVSEALTGVRYGESASGANVTGQRPSGHAGLEHGGPAGEGIREWIG